MSEVAQPDVADEAPHASVLDGLSGGNFGEEGGVVNTSSLSAILAANQPVEPVATVVAPEGTPTPPADDNSGEQTPPDGYVPKEQYDNLQSVLGRQGNELGELRRELDELRAGSQQQQAPDPYSSPFMPVVTEEVRENIEEALMAPDADPEQIAAWAAVNQPHLYDTILDVWAEQGGAAARRAAAFDMRFQQGLQQYQQQEAQTQEQALVAEIGTALDAQVKTLAPEYGFESGNEDHEKILADTLSNSPAAIQDLVVSQDPAAREAGLRAVLAMARVAGGATTPENDGAAQQALAAAQAQARGAATLGTGGLKPVITTPTLSEEERIEAAVAQRLLTRPSTSVSEGLTGGSFGR